MRALLLSAALLAVHSVVVAQEEETKDKPDFSSFTIDIDAPGVSAGTIVGVEKSVIHQIETSQDIAVAFKPFASDDNKAGFGIAITPARTAWLGMAVQDYYADPLKRAMGSVTLSYAENGAEISGTDYRKYGVSVDAFYYLKRGQDPIIVAHDVYGECAERKDNQKLFLDLGRAIRERKKATADELPAARTKEEAARKAYREGMNACTKEASEAASSKARSPWNASRVSVSMGAGWIRPDDKSRSKESLGRSLTLGGVFGLSEDSAAYVAFRRTTKEVDLTTLAGAIEHKSSNLIAARYVYGSKSDNVDAKMLVEISNAKSSKVTEANQVFKYAVGLDKKISKGTWLQFRLGRNRTVDGTATETTGLMTLNFAPTAGLFK